MVRLTQWLSIVTVAVFVLGIGLLLADSEIRRSPLGETGRWVLWEERIIGNTREWRIAGVNQPFEGKPACERAASDQNDSEFTRLLATNEPAVTILRALANFTCLPDTVDPREPKGK
jgi:hypothetical protein